MGPKIVIKCYVEILKLKKVRIIGVDIMVTKVKPPGETPKKEDLIIPQK